jgi:hypothetical protein
MSVNLRTETIPASGQTELTDANFLFILSTANLVTLTFVPKLGTFASGSGQGSAGNEVFGNINAGFLIQRVKGWQKVSVQAPAGTVISFFYGYQSFRDDATLFQTQIATIAGGSILASAGIASPNAPTDHADVSVASGAVDSSIAANPARKSIIIGSLSTNAPSSATPRSLRVQAHPGAASQKGDEVQAGTSITLYTTAALDVYNGDASAQIYWWQEQT